jgi:hypothetical protein
MTAAPFLIAIDGMALSGKTTWLASLTKEVVQTEHGPKHIIRSPLLMRELGFDEIHAVEVHVPIKGVHGVVWCIDLTKDVNEDYLYRKYKQLKKEYGNIPIGFYGLKEHDPDRRLNLPFWIKTCNEYVFCDEGNTSSLGLVIPFLNIGVKIRENSQESLYDPYDFHTETYYG